MVNLLWGCCHIKENIGLSWCDKSEIIHIYPEIHPFRLNKISVLTFNSNLTHSPIFYTTLTIAFPARYGYKRQMATLHIDIFHCAKFGSNSDGNISMEKRHRCQFQQSWSLQSQYVNQTNCDNRKWTNTVTSTIFDTLRNVEVFTNVNWQ